MFPSKNAYALACVLVNKNSSRNYTGVLTIAGVLAILILNNTSRDSSTSPRGRDCSCTSHSRNARKQNSFGRTPSTTDEHDSAHH